MDENIKKPIVPNTPPAAPAGPPDRDHLNDILIEYAPKINMHANSLKEKLGGKDPSELHTAGMHGLYEAIKNYDPNKGASFETYADQRIKGRMLDHVTSGGGSDTNWIPNYHHKQAKAFEAKQKIKPPETKE